jgi:hypothetical protein
MRGAPFGFFTFREHVAANASLSVFLERLAPPIGSRLPPRTTIFRVCNGHAFTAFHFLHCITGNLYMPSPSPPRTGRLSTLAPCCHAALCGYSQIAAGRPSTSGRPFARRPRSQASRPKGGCPGERRYRCGIAKSAPGCGERGNDLGRGEKEVSTTLSEGFSKGSKGCLELSLWIMRLVQPIV